MSKKFIPGKRYVCVAKKVLHNVAKLYQNEDKAVVKEKLQNTKSWARRANGQEVIVRDTWTGETKDGLTMSPLWCKCIG